jgi:hypothetical protein
MTVTAVAIFAARIAGMIDKVALFLPEAPRARLTTKDENLLSSVRAGHRLGFDLYVELRLQV